MSGLSIWPERNPDTRPGLRPRRGLADSRDPAAIWRPHCPHEAVGAFSLCKLPDGFGPWPSPRLCLAVVPDRVNPLWADLRLDVRGGMHGSTSPKEARPGLRGHTPENPSIDARFLGNVKSSRGHDNPLRSV